ncbi:hypothetical protein B0H13DRAFT_2477830 [Mycena leptocephala]|nr:hypothetical protein B0H13DRAFT_2477830 [Mycena leptocephala]
MCRGRYPTQKIPCTNARAHPFPSPKVGIRTHHAARTRTRRHRGVEEELAVARAGGDRARWPLLASSIHAHCTANLSAGGGNRARRRVDSAPSSCSPLQHHLLPYDMLPRSPRRKRTQKEEESAPCPHRSPLPPPPLPVRHLQAVHTDEARAECLEGRDRKKSTGGSVLQRSTGHPPRIRPAHPTVPACTSRTTHPTGFPVTE